MRVLAVADEEAKLYYDYYRSGMLDEFDLIISCGDLSKDYLEFLATLAHCPVLYVCGNHDESFKNDPPGGCICLEDDIYEYRGVRFLGLGGSYRYKVGATYMYTEFDMKRRIFHLLFKLKKYGGFDVLVTHAPAKGLGDLEDLPHRGFGAFRDLLDKYHPKYMIHGHVHLNYGFKIKPVTTYGDTTIINAYQYHKFDMMNF